MAHVLRECWLAANGGDLAECQNAAAKLSGGAESAVLNYVEPSVRLPVRGCTLPGLVGCEEERWCGCGILRRNFPCHKS